MDLSVFIECSTGRTPKIETLKLYIDYLSSFGYKYIYLGLTDCYKMENEPYFNYNRAGYTIEQLQELDKYSKSHNIELRASCQTLGHLGYALKYKCYEDIKDTDDVLLVGEEKTYQFIDKIFKTLTTGISSKTLHIGMDEAFTLGQGKYKSIYGEKSKEDIFIEHLSRVSNIAKAYNISLEIWSDMFFRMVKGSDYENAGGEIPENIKNRIPDNVNLCYWNYLSIEENELNNLIAKNKKICNNVTYAGTVWCGFSLYNRISADHIKKQIDACKKNNIHHYMVTLWTDCTLQDRLLSLPALFATSVYNKYNRDVTQDDKQLFKKVTSIDYDVLLSIDYLNDPFKKNINTYSTRSFIGLFFDLLYGYYDYFFNDTSSEKYEELSKYYMNSGNGEYKLLFKQLSLHAKILSIKPTISKKLRQAYREKDLLTLKKLNTVDIPMLINTFEEYLSIYEKAWLEHYYPQGLECNQFYLSGAIYRIKSINNRLSDFIKNGTPIEEIEKLDLVPSDNFNEENVWYNGIIQLLSFSSWY